jgi:hypothetical protein
VANYGTFSSYQVEIWLATLNKRYVALHFDNPETTGAYMSEIHGGAYARQLVQMSAPDNRATWNVNDLSWSVPPATRISYVAFWDAVVNGNYLCSAPLDVEQTIVAGKRFDYPALSLALSFDS